MSLCAAADELEVFAARDAGVAILVVEAESQQPGFLALFALASHQYRNLPERGSICNDALGLMKWPRLRIGLSPAGSPEFVAFARVAMKIL
jgi:hypothetical protein